MRISIFFFMALFALYSCTPSQKSAKTHQATLYQARTLDYSKKLQTIAFGSCNRQDLPQTIWPEIQSNQPDLWIWLGDNIYADTENMNLMKAKYLQQKYASAYQRFLNEVPVIGIWDDHDYGVNDGDKNFSKKKESKELLFDFLDVPPESEARQREGAYQSYVFGEEGKRVKVILLDTRYFRDELKFNLGLGDRYRPNLEGDILGEAQWRWLEQELRSKEAEVHLICSGIQILPEEQHYEKWANFPKARKRLLELIDKTDPLRPILLSGDRHLAEISVTGLPEKDSIITEITSSGLTHSYKEANESNAYRQGALITYKNYGVLTIDWEAPYIRFEVRIMGPRGKTYLTHQF